MTHDSVSEDVRPPLQARSRESWARVLEAGLDLLRTGGVDALTVAEVCRRAGVSAPSLYARVDGRRGLLLAVYEAGMADVEATERDELTAAEPTVPGVTRAVHAVFDRHAALLRAIIRYATSDPEIMQRGSARSIAFVERIAGVLPGDGAYAHDAARHLYTACAFRVVYTTDFWGEDDRDDERFIATLASTTSRLLTTTARPSPR